MNLFVPQNAENCLTSRGNICFKRRTVIHKVSIGFSLGEGSTKRSNKVYNKFTNKRQHNKYLLDHIGYMFRPVTRSSPGLK